jgi:hypothetical protein
MRTAGGQETDPPRECVQSPGPAPVDVYSAARERRGRLADVTLIGATLGLRARPLVLEITEHDTIEAYRPLREAVQRLGPDSSGRRRRRSRGGELHPPGRASARFRQDRRQPRAGREHGSGAAGRRRGSPPFCSRSPLRHHRRRHRNRSRTGHRDQARCVTLGQGYLLGRPAPAESWADVEGGLSSQGGAGPTLRVERRAWVRGASLPGAEQAG